MAMDASLAKGEEAALLCNGYSKISSTPASIRYDFTKKLLTELDVPHK